MLDGRVLGASQVEYKPFGKPPLKKENLHSSRVPCYMCYMCYILHAKPPNLPGSLLYVLHVLYLTRQAAEPPLSPGPCYMCYMCYILHAKPLNPHSPQLLASRPRPDTPARRVIRIIRIIRSYGHTAAWHCATLPRLPGIEASPAAPPDRVFFYHSHAHPSILAWAHDCPFNPGVGAGLPEKPITGSSPKVCQRCCEDGIADIVFFSPFTRPTVNPGAGTGLPHSILAWAQDCPTQSWRGHPEKTPSASCCVAVR